MAGFGGWGVGRDCYPRVRPEVDGPYSREAVREEGDDDGCEVSHELHNIIVRESVIDL